jgi:hypothetical protein
LIGLWLSLVDLHCFWLGLPHGLHFVSKGLGLFISVMMADRRSIICSIFIVCKMTTQCGIKSNYSIDAIQLSPFWHQFSCAKWLDTGFGLIIVLLHSSKLVTSGNSNTFTSSHTSQFTIARVKSSLHVLIRHCLAMASTAV